MTSRSSTRRHIYIPDGQVRPGVPLDHWTAIGNYIVEKQPDAIINGGDFADMYSLNSYDKGTRHHAMVASIQDDLDVTHEAMSKLMTPIWDHQKKQRRNNKKRWNPSLDLTLGNHEARIDRAVKYQPELTGFLSIEKLLYAEAGWTVHPFLQPVEIDGILYSHFFPRAPSGRVMQNRRGAPNARLQAAREHQSCTAGHMQGFDYAEVVCHDRVIHGLIAGSCYTHEEDYLTPQGTQYWRGIIVKNEVRDGQYDICKVSLNYLLDNYL